MPDHTPGPWEYARDDEPTAFPGALRVFHHSTRQPVCWHVHTEADARLIVAAPALLGAARIALLILCRDGLQPLRGLAWNDSELHFIKYALEQAGESLENYNLPEGA